MPKMKSEFQKTVEKLLKPTLIENGFREIRLINLMKPEVLYRKNDLWFGTSWDWRDRDLEVSLGHLYWFKDFMPRIVVVGDYSSYLKETENIILHHTDSVNESLPKVANTLVKSLEIFESNYDQIKSEFINCRIKRTPNFESYILNRATDSNLKKYWA